MASFKEMTKDGTIKRADASKIRHEDIHIEEGFNLTGRNDSDDEEDKSLFDFIMAGGKLPDLEVRPREEGGVWIVDGHRRHKQLGRADKAGAPLRNDDGELWVSVTQFIGNDVDRNKRLITSERKKSLTALQIAEGYARLERFNLSLDNIAKEFSKTRQHVEQMLILAHANHDVHQAVTDGIISPTEAVNMVRKHGELAGAFIRGAADKTGGKVTAKAVKPWSPPAKIAQHVLDKAETIALSVEPKLFHQLLEAEMRGTLPHQIVNIEINSGHLLEFMRAISATQDLRIAAEQKSRDKAAKAAQVEIAGA